jgi:hypothetical protein
LPKRHPITVSFGEPISPSGDTAGLIEQVQRFFDDVGGSSGPYRSPYGRLTRKRDS